jgi:hypothetical protein
MSVTSWFKNFSFICFLSKINGANLLQMFHSLLATIRQIYLRMSKCSSVTNMLEVGNPPSDELIRRYWVASVKKVSIPSVPHGIDYFRE